MTTNPSSGTGPDGLDALAGAVDTVRKLLAAGLIDAAALGLGPAAAAEPSATPLPGHTLVPGAPITVRDLVAKARLGLKDSTRRTYGSYMTLLADGYADPLDPTLAHPGFGDLWAHELLPSQLEDLLRFVRRRALAHAARRAERRHSVGRAARDSDGTGACYNAVGAWRRVFSVAVKDRHLARHFNPAREISKPTRLTGKRRPLTDEQCHELWRVVAGTGNDPELDWMLCRTIIICGARREGLLNLTLGGLDRDGCTVRLDEKFDKVDYQPAPDWFVDLLHDFAVRRGATHPTDKVFRLAPRGDDRAGTPITSRRLDGLFQRVQSLLKWADRDQVTAHTLRHHAIALVERHAGHQVSMAFARHQPASTHDLYGRASREEVARAVIELHGGTHPLVPGP